MISDKMAQALNDQIKLEGDSSFVYLAMASWCDSQGLGGCAEFLFRQSEEEHEHMMKIFNYLLEMDRRAYAPAISEASKDFGDIATLFEKVYSHEQKVTKSINELANLAAEESDHSTSSFLQWFIDEQREEEALMRSILDKIKLIGDGPQRLYYIDKEIEVINQKTIAAESEA